MATKQADRSGQKPQAAAAETEQAENGGAKHAPPIWKKRVFSSGSYVECAVFRHEVEQGESSFTSHSVSLRRSYRDGDAWKDTRSLRSDDLLVASHLLQRAYAWISDQER